MWFYFMIALIMLILGLLIHKAKAYFLISGYNTYSREKQKNVDVEGLGRLMGYYGYANALVFFLAGILDYLGVSLGIAPVSIFFGGTTLFLLVKAQKYDRNMYGEDGRMTKKSKIQVALMAGAGLLIFLFVGIMMYTSSRDTVVSMDAQGMEIHGMYGDVYSWDTMEELKLLDQLPQVTLRTNGSGIGSKLRGNFKMKEYGQVKLFMDIDVPPYIYFSSDGKIVIFNLGEEEKTRAAFREMEGFFKD